MSQPKLLVIDIETKPAIAFAWKMFDVNIGLEQLIRPSSPICFAAKFVGEKEVFFHADWIDGHESMIKAAHRLISEADAVLTYNGDSFDIPKLQGEFLLAGLAPPPPITSIDVYKSVKKLGFQSGKLAYVGPLLRIGAKVKNEGFRLWSLVEEGNEKAQKRMQKYCIGDVTLLEKLYMRIRPYVKNHPHMGLTKGSECGACGSSKLQSRGYRRTKTMKIQRVHCQNCGSWQDGTRSKV